MTITEENNHWVIKEHNGVPYDIIVRVSSSQKPTIKEVDFLVEKHIDQMRRDEYPSIQNQIDMLFHDKINGTNEWVKTIRAVKNKFPKP